MGKISVLGVLRLRVPKGRDTSLRMTDLWGDEQDYGCTHFHFVGRRIYRFFVLTCLRPSLSLRTLVFAPARSFHGNDTKVSGKENR
jgi:hypothetical protein